MKWEYKFEKLPSESDPESVVEMFNRLGNDGWEFMDSEVRDFPSRYDHNYKCVYYFKRIKE